MADHYIKDSDIDKSIKADRNRVFDFLPIEEQRYKFGSDYFADVDIAAHIQFAARLLDGECQLATSDGRSMPADICLLDSMNRKNWIEVVCPRLGEDQITLESLAYDDYTTTVELLTMILAAIDKGFRNKVLSLVKKIRNREIKQNEPVIIAISAANLPHGYHEYYECPLSLTHLYGLGAFSRQDNGTIIRERLPSKVQRVENSQHFQTGYFNRGLYPEISQVIYLPNRLGLNKSLNFFEMQSIHNPAAKVPAEEKVIKLGTEYFTPKNKRLKSYSHRHQEDGFEHKLSEIYFAGSQFSDANC